MKRLLVIFFLWLSGIIHAQSTNSYFIRFISEADSSSIPFAAVSAIVADTMQNGWITDIDGMIEIKETEMNQDAIYKVSAYLYNPAKILPGNFLLNDTFIVLLRPAPVSFNDIEIVSYRIFVDPDKQDKKKKKKKKEEPMWGTITPLYTMEQYAVMDSIADGEWFKARPKGIGIDLDFFYEYLQDEIKYPEYDREKGIEEKVWFSLKFGDKGIIEQIKLMKADSPLMVLAVAQVLVKIGRILPNDFGGSISKGAEIYLPVNFRLK